MPGTSWRPLAPLALVFCLLAYVGCTSQPDATENAATTPTSAVTTPTKVTPSSTPEPKPAPSPPRGVELFANWPKPDGALLISGERDGYLEPCGCTSGQLGSRRLYDLVEQIHGRGWPLALVDLGSLIKNAASSRGGPEQAKIKFGVALSALTLLKYDALALSVDDLKLDVGDVCTQYLNLGDRPKILAANVVVGVDDLKKKIVPSLKTSAGPIKIGVTAVLDPEAYKKLRDEAKELFLPSVIEPSDALAKVWPDLEKDTDTQVLLVQGPPELAKSLAKAFPGFDIVVSTSLFDPAEDVERLNDGKTMLVSVGQKGKYVAVVGLYQDPKEKPRFQRVSLTDQFGGKAEPMRKLIEDDLQDMLKQVQVVENFPRRSVGGATPGATFVGAETCKSCHKASFQKWADSKHFQAFEDIVTDPKGLRSDHQFDAECVSCHTTGFEYTSGWVSDVKTPHLEGNQCENCHGPASKHVAEPDNVAYLKAIKRTLVAADQQGLCARCHDEDNSPHFDFAKYWKEIDHKGLDDYKDPKVHKGIDPKVAGQNPK